MRSRPLVWILSLSLVFLSSSVTLAQVPSGSGGVGQGEMMQMMGMMQQMGQMMDRMADMMGGMSRMMGGMMGGSTMGPGMGMGGGSMGPSMRGPGVMGPGGSRIALHERPVITIILRLREQLGLSSEQVAKLTALRSNYEVETIRTGAEIRVIEVDLDELLDQDKVDLAKVEAAFRKEESLQTNLRLARIKAIEAGKAVLSVEQREKLRKALEAGPGMMGPGMMGSGGQEMMMGGQMMQQMMGGGLGQQVAAGSNPSPVTAVGSERIDTTGPVTVKATLLDPGAVGDSLRIQIVLDTHSVNLDSYRFEEIARLRDGRGSELVPAAVEGAKGSGHHREATVRFNWPEPKPKTLELVVRGVAGVSERVFRWPAQ